MSKCRPFSRVSADNGYSIVELVLSTALAMMALAATSSLFIAGRGTLRNEDVVLETAHAIRTTTDLLLRDLRLGGACLPVTGGFVALSGVNNGTTDEIVSRSGLTRADLSCVRSASVESTMEGASSIKLETADGFRPGVRAYVRHPNGTGEYFTVTSVDGATNTISSDVAFALAYPPTSGVYGIEERRYSVDLSADPPVLQMQINGQDALPFAIGIEKLDIKYQLKRNCPTCDVVDLPTDNNEWALVDQMLLTLTARSSRTSESGETYRKTMTVRVKPRNLLP